MVALTIGFKIVFRHFLLAQKVTKKGTTKTNHLLGLVARTYTPGLAKLAVRTFRGQPSLRRNRVFAKNKSANRSRQLLLLLPLVLS